MVLAVDGENSSWHMFFTILLYDDQHMQTQNTPYNMHQCCESMPDWNRYLRARTCHHVHTHREGWAQGLVLALIAAMILVGMVATAGGAQAQSQALALEPLTIETQRGSFHFKVEIADDGDKRAIGLMNRKTLNADHGMLFVFEQSRMITMWMKNTLISLDMIFVDKDGVVKSISKATTPQSLALISSGVPVPFVLEIKAGVSNYIGLKPGDRLRHRLFP